MLVIDIEKQISLPNSALNFVSFYNKLVQNNKDDSIYHFFKRGYSYFCHGEKALFIGKFYFKSNSIIRNENGLDLVEMNRKVFASVAKDLLNTNQIIFLWTKNDSKDSLSVLGSGWNILAKASPGSHDSLENVIGSLSSDLSFIPYIASIFVSNTSKLQLGVSIASKSLGIIKFFQFESSPDFYLLESLLIQYNVAECILLKISDSYSDDSNFRINEFQFNSNLLFIKNLVEKMNIKISYLNDINLEQLLKIKSSDIKDEINRIKVQESNQFESKSFSEIFSENIFLMKAALYSGFQLFVYLNIWKNDSYKESFLVSLGNFENFLSIDNNTSRALLLFPGKDQSNKIEFKPNDIEPKLFGDSFSDINDNEPSNFQKPSDLEDPIDELNSIHPIENDGFIENTHGIGKAYSNSLFSVINKTKTLLGSRKLRQWLQMPLIDINEIRRRQSIVELFVDNPILLTKLRDQPDLLFKFPDLESIGNNLRLYPKRVSLKDLLSLYRGLSRLDSIEELLKEILPSINLDEKLSETPKKDDFSILSEFLQLLTSQKKYIQKYFALVEKLIDIDRYMTSFQSLDLDEKIFIDKWIRVRPSFSQLLLGIYNELEEMDSKIRAERQKIINQIQIDKKSIHLEWSEVHAIHLRTTKKQSTDVFKKLKSLKIPFDILTTLKTGVLFTTPQLKIFSSRFIRINRQYKEEQNKILIQAVQVASSFCPLIQSISNSIADLDCLSTLAQVALFNEWTKPSLHEIGSKTLKIENMRHPCLESVIGSHKIVPNSIECDKSTYSFIITGPNMGGKSTFIKTIAICVVLSHIGSFIPASFASIPIFDKILIRVGSSECSQLGISTFMSEMIDSSAILNRATPNSLILIDEIGRGTSIQDGFGLAWSIFEHIVDNIKCISFFATHFHELTFLGNEYTEKSEPNSIQNLHATAKVSSNLQNVVMTFKIIPGASMKSFGIHVAKSAGFPDEIIKEAFKIEKSLETQVSLSEDLDLTAPIGQKRKRPVIEFEKIKEILSSLNDEQIENREDLYQIAKKINELSPEQ